MTIEVLPSRDGVRVVRLTGEVDVVSTRVPYEELAPPGALVLDLSDVSFFDSSGVRLVDRVAREHQGRLRVVAPRGGRARRVLDLVGYGSELVAEDVEQAVAALRG